MTLGKDPDGRTVVQTVTGAGSTEITGDVGGRVKINVSRPTGDPASPVGFSRRHMSILNHDIWPYVLPFIRLDYARNESLMNTRQRRARIEVNPINDNPRLLWCVLCTRARCVRCQQWMSPFRIRLPNDPAEERPARLLNAIYFGGSCGGTRDTDGIRSGCSKGKAIKEEYKRIVACVEGHPNRAQYPTLPLPPHFPQLPNPHLPMGGLLAYFGMR